VAVVLSESGAMGDIFQAAREGDVGEVDRLLGQDLGLLNAKTAGGWTPLMHASGAGHVGVARCLLDKGAATNEKERKGFTALVYACSRGHPPVVRLLLEWGGDPTIAGHKGITALMTASHQGHLEIVRSLLDHPSTVATINHRADNGGTALLSACFFGRGKVARALMESGANPTIATTEGGTTPVAVAKQTTHEGHVDIGVSAEGRRECVVALEVRSCLLTSPPQRPGF
jgi:ankyrin repeat protein